MSVQTRKNTARIGLLVGLVLGASFAAGPIVWMLSNSFKSNTEIFELPPRLITESFSFDAYLAIFTDPEKVRFFINSYVIAFSVTALTLLVAIQAAYALS
ncbi:carbohydrate ABC transporter permease, partial [Rhizobium johnstonii]